ncbi:forkhead box protein N1 [Sceloporus undulatus]|uniref:forkhead box protein N1 n=1 Tax=Sceloporus undulatus TaxID=8520 RepID=UPI001C4AB64D|nr:forkhead box protein N1 [Sceloporus undulatus]
MVSLLQDQANITFPSSSSGRLESQPCSDRMQSHEAVSSPGQQEAPNFCCQPFEVDHGAERDPSESSQSSSPSSPPPDHLYGRFLSHRGAHTEKALYPALQAAEKFHRFGYEDGNALGSCASFLKSASDARSPFHPYKRQFAEEDPLGAAEGVPPFKAASMEGYAEGAVPAMSGEAEMYGTQVPSLSGEPAWCKGLPYGLHGHHPQAMETDIKLKTPSLEEQPSLYCYQPQVPSMYCPSHPFHQYPAGGGSSYPVTYLSAASSHYPFQRIAPQGPPEHHQPLFPKPIYSYSILIFMALKNSKTGSLPVSEIYNFMTEHFPYFKTAPDGWKNSVRHNLSLNKCFEKVENKSGSSSRKGCLWALNPAKIDKMQEELQKWKRKDPVAVRKSMAKPEELDTLIGDKSEKLRSSLMSGGNPPGVASPPSVSRQMTLAHPSLHGPRGQDPPLPAQSPPSGRGAKVLSGPRSVQDVLVPDADLNSDIDALNPSLTDFDLQGNLWEELKDDSLAADPLALVSSSPGVPPCFSAPCQMDHDNDNNNDNSNELNSHRNAQQSGLPEIHLTTLYSAFMELDTGSAPFLNSLGSKPIALV